MSWGSLSPTKKSCLEPAASRASRQISEMMCSADRSTMACVASVFALLAALEDRYDLPTAGLGWIAGSAFVSLGAKGT